MKNVLNLLARVAEDEEGAAMIEYSILLGVIAVAVVGIAAAVGNWSKDQWVTLCQGLQLGNAVCTP